MACSVSLLKRLQKSATGLPPLSVIVTSSVLMGLGSCTSTLTPETTATLDRAAISAETEDLQVITTFLPITQFTQAVAGDRAEVTQLIPLSADPHHYQARPEEIQNLAGADVLVQNGLEMEVFLEDMIANANNANLVIIDSSEGIATIAAADLEDAQAENAPHNHHQHEHSPPTQDEAVHRHGEFNPHIWLDPKRAIQQVANIRDGLITVDPAGEAEYRANAATYIADLQALDEEIAAILAPYAGRTFVAFHDLASYFAESYNLKAEFLVDTPDENPSPDDVKRIIDTVATSNLKALLIEPQVGAGGFEALASDLNIQVSSFDPIETGGPEALDPEYYLTIMRQNVQHLETAFGASTQF